MRTLYFDFISDSRFDQGIQEKICAMRESLLSTLPDNVQVAYDDARLLQWGIYENCERSDQWRQRFYIQKPKGITWNSIMSMVNSVKPVQYKYTNENMVIHSDHSYNVIVDMT